MITPLFTTLLVAASPFIVTWLTGVTKNHVFSSVVGSAAVRLVCAVLSVILAVLTGMATNDGHFVGDAGGLVNEFVLALLNFLGATGLFHLGATQSASRTMVP